MDLRQDFKDLLELFNSNKVDFMIVGAYALAFYGAPRLTGDMDIWVHHTPDNYVRLRKAFVQFGMSVFNMPIEKFMSAAHYDVFTFGRPPVSIDILS